MMQNITQATVDAQLFQALFFLPDRHAEERQRGKDRYAG
jgi:hypothetical protein